MQRAEGWRAPGSGRGFPHGKHKKELRRERAKARAGKPSAFTYHTQGEKLGRKAS